MNNSGMPLSVKILLVMQQAGMLLFWLTNYIREPILIFIVLNLGGLCMAVSFMIIFVLLYKYIRKPYINQN